MKIIITESQIQNIIKKNLVAEALPLSQAKEHMSIKRNERIQNQIDNIWNELLKLPNIQTSKRKDRIYIPYTGSDDKEYLSNNPVKKEVEDFLSSKGYKLNDYIKGTVIEPKYNREVKIGKVIDNPDLLKKFNLDDARAGSRKTNSYIVISKHPYDIAGMSTDRGWDSCMNLDTGCYSNYVKEDVKYGTLVAYFIKKNDLNIKTPSGRVLIKPYFNKQYEVAYNVSSTIYGSTPSGFQRQLKDIFNNINSRKKKSSYFLSKKLYNDNDDDNEKGFNYSINEFENLSNEMRLQYLDYIGDDFERGISKVIIEGKYNFINTKGELVSDIWFDSVNLFYDHKITAVKLKEKYNFINTEGKLISDVWFDYAGLFFDGFAQVKLIDKSGKEKYNFINSEGKLISDTWFDDAKYFNDGFAQVKLIDKSGKNKWNYINTKSEILSDRWFDMVDAFKNGFAQVKLIDKSGKEKYNFINSEGKLISDTWFDDAKYFNDGFAQVKLIDKSGKNKWNYINTKSEILSDRWFDMVDAFKNGFSIVRLSGKWNYINTKGEIISDTWFDNIGDFFDGLATVKLIDKSGKDKWYFINTEGNILTNTWFDYATDFFNGFSIVRLSGKWNYINTKGEIISDTWFDDAKYFRSNGFAEITLNDKLYKIDSNGNLFKTNMSINIKGDN